MKMVMLHTGKGSPITEKDQRAQGVETMIRIGLLPCHVRGVGNNVYIAAIAS
jgi:hypothetical protein